MQLKILDIINIIICFQLVVFSIFLLNKSKGKVSNIVLAVFFISQALSILDFLCFSLYDYVFEYCPWLFYIGRPFSYIWAPALFLYIKLLAYSDFKLKLRHILHLLPFIIFFLFLSIKYHIYDNETKRELLIHDAVISLYWAKILALFPYMQISVYLSFCFQTLNSYNKKVKQQFSSFNQHNLNWLKFFIIGYSIAFIISFILYIIVFIGVSFYEYLVFIMFFLFFILFNLIFYRALIKPHVFIGIPEKSKYTTSTLPKHEVESLLKRIMQYMKDNKPYMMSDITINELADKIEIPVRHLSQIINEYQNQNFYDFINFFRIEEAKKMLINTSYFNKTVKEIYYEVGFNSKTSFFNSFKKYTSMTPTKYKQINL